MRSWLWMGLVVAGCDNGGHTDDTDDTDGLAQDACPVDDARALVEEVVNDAVLDTSWMAEHSGGAEMAFAFALPGGDRIHAGSMFLIAPCTEPTAFEPYCSGDMAEGAPADQLLCSQLGCDAADVTTVDLWFAHEDHTDEDDRHALSYAATPVSGTVTYDPNPLRRWTTDATGDGVVSTATVDEQVVVGLDGGGTVDLSRSGTLVATRAADDSLLAEVDLVFASGLTVDVDMDQAGGTGGSVVLDGETVATIGPGEERLVFTWTCP